MVSLAQSVLGIIAVFLAVRVRTPWLGVFLLAIVVASVIAANRIGKYRSSLLIVGAISTAAIPVSYFLPKNIPFTWDAYFVMPAWLIAGAIFLVARSQPAASAKQHWNYFAMFWCLLGPVSICAAAYDRNQPGYFYFGIALTLLGFIIGKWLVRPGIIGVQVANTAIILLLGLPLADLCVRPAYLLEASPDLSKKYYSFEAAHKDPSAYARWWRYYISQLGKMGGAVYMPDPQRRLPFLLRPGSQGFLFNSKISINSLGFRGKEIPIEKGDAYRIVALGESSTFGCTLNKEDRPWPELLEDMIRERLKPDRPVEVINAGVPSYVITHNVFRLSSDIFPLKPDLLISYHGYNGFFLLYSALAPGTGAPPPAYAERPVRLFANLEYKLKLSAYKKHIARRAPVAVPAPSKLLETPYAKAYEDLVRATRTNGIRLAMANFSMAVTSNSPPDVIEFFRGGFPSIYWEIQANAAHNRLVRELVAEHPDVCFIDMHPHLNGQHDKFIDAMHMTQPGRQQAAENVFAAIRPILERDLASHSSPRNH